MSDARFAARSRGTRAVTERDFATEAAQAAGMTNPFAPSPADVLPEHYDSILDSLEHIRSAARAQAKLGGGHIAHGPSRRARAMQLTIRPWAPLRGGVPTDFGSFLF